MILNDEMSRIAPLAVLCYGAFDENCSQTEEGLAKLEENNCSKRFF